MQSESSTDVPACSGCDCQLHSVDEAAPPSVDYLASIVNGAKIYFDSLEACEAEGAFGQSVAVFMEAALGLMRVMVVRET